MPETQDPVGVYWHAVKQCKIVLSGVHRVRMPRPPECEEIMQVQFDCIF